MMAQKGDLFSTLSIEQEMCLQFYHTQVIFALGLVQKNTATPKITITGMVIRHVTSTSTHLGYSGVTRYSGAPGQISKSSPPSPYPTFPSFCPVWGQGTPLPPCPFTFSSFPPFTFLFLSLALPIFFFCPSLPFLPE